MLRGIHSGSRLEPRRGGGGGSTVSRACRRPWHGRPSCARAGRAMALFIGARWRGGGSGRAGKRSTGVGAAGEGAARRVARRPSSGRAQERKGGVASSGAPGKVGWGNTRGAEAVWSWGATRGAARWWRRRTAPAVGTVQGSERLKNRPVAVS